MRIAAIGRAAAAFMRWLCFVFVSLIVIPAWANEAAGLSWLQGQLLPTGALASESISIALPVQVRSEAIATLHAKGATVPAALQSALDGVSDDTVEILARKSLARQSQSSDKAYLDPIAQKQNADGGFGATAGYASNPQDTAWALAALAASRADYAAVVNQAVTYLLAVQQPSGQWDMAPDGDALLPTALAVQALQPYRQTTAVATALTKARAWLLAERGADFAWGSPTRNAQALLAVLPGLATAATMQPAVAALAGAQRQDGSWEGDPYITALALRALFVAGQPVTDPDMASLQGRVLDADTGAPVTGALVRLAQRGLEARTDGVGQFRFTLLTQGQDQLDIQAAGYRTLISVLQLQAGQQLDLGAIRLKTAGAGVADTAVTVAGSLRYFNGAGYYAASGARVQSGSQSATADSTGAYRLQGLPAGRVDLTATFSGYPSVQSSVTAQPGQAVDFSPVFRQPRGSTATLSVSVSDTATGAPLPGVTVVLQAVSRTTDAQGKVSFTSGLLVGRNSLTLSKSGYERALMTFDATEGQAIVISTALAQAVSTQAVLRGVVTDALTRMPLAGVSVRVLDPAVQALTDAQGAYSVTHPQLGGSRTVELSRSGYAQHRQTISVGSAAVNTFNVPLQPQSAAAGPARLDVSVVVRGTGAALEGASVVLTGTNLRTLTTDVAGQAQVTNLNPGDTQIVVSAEGFESAVGSVNVKASQNYQLPVELLPAVNAPPKLYGQVVDAVSQKPVSNAQVALTGAVTALATTSANGYYEFDNVTAGEVRMAVTGEGYVAAQKDFSLTGTTEVKVPLTPIWQVGPVASWEVFGSVVDADSSEPLVGANLVLEEVLVGSAVVSSQAGSTQLGGSFAFNGLTETDGRITITLNGYDTTLVPFSRHTASQSLGSIKLKRSYNASLPDLMLSLADRSSLTVDANTFKAHGSVTARVTNNSNYDAVGFDAIAFLDTDGNHQWDPAVDVLLAKVRVAPLPAQQSQLLQWNVQEAQLPFRDAPIYLMADSGLEVIENIEGNNTLRVGVSCAGGGGVQDVGVCIDTSGSVANLYHLEMEGVIKAVENPNIIPHDGSIRFMLGTDHEMFYGTGIIPLHPAKVITPATLPPLIADLKAKRNPGGRSSGPTCVRRMSEYMKSLPQSGGSKTVITVGDGYWEGIAKAQAELPITVANGVSRVDVIGIGSVNLPELEANAWPKPVNSLLGGKVTVAYSSGEVAAAMAQALGAAAQTVDLTLGDFRIVDKGQGHAVALQARIGNAGSPSQPTSVRFYQGVALLGELAVPALRTGEWVDVKLEQAALLGTEPLTAVVDESRTNAECNTGNNSQQAFAVAGNRLASLQVQTDRTSYPANAPVVLSAVAENRGSFAAGFSVLLAIHDAQNQEVTRFSAVSVSALAAGARQTATQTWNTANLLTGTYTLRGTLIDQAGEVAAQDSTLFAITAGTGMGGPKAALTVAVDKAQYTPNERVQIASLVRNLTGNAVIDDARVQVTMRGPDGGIVFTHTHTVSQLPAQGIWPTDVNHMLRGVAEGVYTIEAVFQGNGEQLKRSAVDGLSFKANDTAVTLATAQATFTVRAAAAAQPSTPGDVTPIPVDHPWWLLLASVTLAGIAIRRLGAQARPLGRRGGGQ